MGKLDGKVAFVTGAGSGIAKATALMFTREGAKVAIADINREWGQASEKQVRDAGGDGTFVETDVTRQDSVKHAIDVTAARYGKIDVIMNCAGFAQVEDLPVHQMDVAVWQRTIALNLLGPFLCCRYSVPYMIKAGGGSIINFGSWLGNVGAMYPAYSAAKGGVVAFTRVLACQYAQKGIRANAITPGVVRTERMIKRWESKDSVNCLYAENPTPEARTRLAIMKNYPFSVGDPQDIASIAVFLASNESRMITGSIIAADGGRSSYLAMAHT